jgi:hypothetical protein
VPPASTGTAAGEPVAGVVEEAVAETAQVEAETEPPATDSGKDSELHTNDDAS